MENINKLFLYLLYANNTQIKIDFENLETNNEDWYDNNIFKYLQEKLLNKKLGFLANNSQINKIPIATNYNYETDEYYNECFVNNALNYYGASLAYDKYGLQRSQLKTLTSTLISLDKNNKFISINGGPGTGKSTLLNYIISNILISSMIKQYKNSKYKNFTNFIKDNKYFKFPTFLLTGTTKVSVQNISDICKINSPQDHSWIYIENDENNKNLNDWFNSLDYDLTNAKNNTKTKEINLNLNSFKKYKNEIKNNFWKKANKYFNSKFLSWYEICNKMYSQIQNNINKINNINSLIEDIFKESISEKMNLYFKSLNKQKLFSNINKQLEYIKESKLTKKEKILTYHSKVIDIISNLEKKEITSNDKTILEIKEKIDKFKKLHNHLLLFKTKNNIKKRINKINFLFKKLFYSTNEEIYNFFPKLNNVIEEIKKLFTSEEIKELGLNKVDKFDVNMDEKDLIVLISSLDVIRINFNIIQQKLDTKYRTENIYLYRHICEWLYIENNFENTQEIKPIISCNLQGINIDKINSVWNTNINKFDYMIVDEAGQVSSKFIPYISCIANQIIVVGDMMQISSIQDKLISKNLKLLTKYFDNNEIYNLMNILSNEFDIIEYKNNDIEYKYKSLLDWMNYKSNIVSKTSNNVQNGLILLEHFRCPYQIFSLINEYFYDNNLIFMNHVDEQKCSFSSIFDKKTTCEEVSLIQIKYKYKNSNNEMKSNLQEIEIGINFIIDNLKNILFHNNKNWNGCLDEKEYNYLINNVAFVTLYRNQKKLIEEVIENICKNLNAILVNETNLKYKYDFVKNLVFKIKKNFKINEINFISNFFKNIKKGTIDSVQGIGCDFVIFSNVSNKYENKNEKINEFEFSENRTNVLWTRTKKHFIHIISDQYWDNFPNKKIKDVEFRFESEVNSNKLNLSRMVFDLYDTQNDDFSIQKLITKYRNFKNIKLQINEIGKYGEEVFNSILRDHYFSELLSLKIARELNVNLDFKNNTKWVNGKKESFLNYDFVTHNEYYIDVKSTRKIKNNEILISKDEWIFGKNKCNKYIVAKINNVTKYNLNLNNLSSKAFVLNNISFYMYDKNILKNNNNSIYYIFREDL